MQKLQDFFKKSDGSDVLDTPVTFTLVSLKGNKAPDRGYGEKFDVRLAHGPNNDPVSWELTDEQIQRIFRKVYQDKVEWEAKDGDVVEIAKCTPMKEGGRVYYKASAAGAGRYNGGRTKSPVSSSGTPTSAPSVSPYDGSHRQQTFRNGLLELTSAIIASGQMKPETPLADVISLAGEYLLEARAKADELEAMYPMH